MLFLHRNLLHEESVPFPNCFKRQNRGFESKTVQSMTNQRFSVVLVHLQKA